MHLVNVDHIIKQLKVNKKAYGPVADIIIDFLDTLASTSSLSIDIIGVELGAGYAELISREVRLRIRVIRVLNTDQINNITISSAYRSGDSMNVFVLSRAGYVIGIIYNFLPAENLQKVTSAKSIAFDYNEENDRYTITVNGEQVGTADDVVVLSVSEDDWNPAINIIAPPHSVTTASVSNASYAFTDILTQEIAKAMNDKEYLKQKKSKVRKWKYGKYILSGDKATDAALMKVMKVLEEGIENGELRIPGVSR